MLMRMVKISKMSYLKIQNHSQCSFGCALEVHLTQKKISKKDLGHFWLGYIRILGHLQMSAHLVNFDRL